MLIYPEKYRIQGYPEQAGAFLVPFEGRNLRVIASNGEGIVEWDHVSVSLPNRCPNWREMSHIKKIFFEEKDIVIQFHVGKSQHINVHPYCLHLWRHHTERFPLPPVFLV